MEHLTSPRQADLAHEMRNVVTSIIACAQTLLDAGDRLDGATKTALADVVTTQAGELRRLLALDGER